jgi:hypothetical protein
VHLDKNTNEGVDSTNKLINQAKDVLFVWYNKVIYDSHYDRCKWDNMSHTHLLFYCFCNYLLGNSFEKLLKYIEIYILEI